MKRDCGKFLEMRLAERTDHDVKWHWLMVVMRVNLTELKDATWYYLASTRLVVS